MARPLSPITHNHPPPHRQPPTPRRRSKRLGRVTTPRRLHRHPQPAYPLQRRARPAHSPPSLAGSRPRRAHPPLRPKSARPPPPIQRARPWQTDHPQPQHGDADRPADYPGPGRAPSRARPRARAHGAAQHIAVHPLRRHHTRRSPAPRAPRGDHNPAPATQAPPGPAATPDRRGGPAHALMRGAPRLRCGLTAAPAVATVARRQHLRKGATPVRDPMPPPARQIEAEPAAVAVPLSAAGSRTRWPLRDRRPRAAHARPAVGPGGEDHHVLPCPPRRPSRTRARPQKRASPLTARRPRHP
jgi:hypothetical protein